MNNKLAVFALAIGLAAPAVHAADDSTRIYKSPIAATEATKHKKFAINAELGRAWVEVDKHYAMTETSDFRRIVVPGLSYDREKSEVIFDADGRRVVCATVEKAGWWIFTHQRIEPTGSCELTHRYVKVPVDNGFAIDHIEHFEVHFKAPAYAGNAG